MYEVLYNLKFVFNKLKFIQIFMFYINAENLHLKEIKTC